MPDKANVTSVEAIEAFRAHLILYVSKARPAVEEVSSDVLRLRLWLESDQRMQLEGLARRRRKEFEQAQATLTSARMAVIRHETTAEQMAMQRARRAMEEVEHKLKRLKYWDREFATVVEPLAKQLEKLHTVLSHDMNKATIYLARVVEMLSAYAEVLPEAGDAGAGGGGGTGTASGAGGAEPSGSGGVGSGGGVP
jgi:hypothetical protein